MEWGVDGEGDRYQLSLWPIKKTRPVVALPIFSLHDMFIYICSLFSSFPSFPFVVYVFKLVDVSFTKYHSV